MHIVEQPLDFPYMSLCGQVLDTMTDTEPDWDEDVPYPPKLCSACRKEERQ
jgi:hypothetical protein